MTDLETIKALFTKRGIEFTEEPRQPRKEVVYDRQGRHETIIEQEGIELTVYGGYVGFLSLFTFDGSGELLSVGAFE